MEYDVDCSEQWPHKTTSAQVVIVLQGDPAMLTAFVERHKNKSNMIVSDSVHTMAH